MKIFNGRLICTVWVKLILYLKSLKRSNLCDSTYWNGPVGLKQNLLFFFLNFRSFDSILVQSVLKSNIALRYGNFLDNIICSNRLVKSWFLENAHFSGIRKYWRIITILNSIYTSKCCFYIKSFMQLRGYDWRLENLETSKRKKKSLVVLQLVQKGWVRQFRSFFTILFYPSLSNSLMEAKEAKWKTPFNV